MIARLIAIWRFKRELNANLAARKRAFVPFVNRPPGRAGKRERPKHDYDMRTG